MVLRRAVLAGLKAVEFEATLPVAHFVLGRAYAKIGECELAIEALTEAVRIAGSIPRFEGSLGYAYARAGRRADADAILDRIRSHARARVDGPASRRTAAHGSTGRPNRT